MKRYLSLLFIFSLSSFGQVMCPNLDSISSLEKNIKEIVSGSMLACTVEEGPDFSEAQIEFKTYFPDETPVLTEKIGDILVEGTKEQLAIARDVLAPPSPDKWEQKVQGCTKVLCIFSKLLGSKEAAMRVFNIAKRNGYILRLGPFSNEEEFVKDHQLFTEKQIRNLDRGFKSLPNELNRLSGLKNYFRLADGKSASQSNQASAWARKKNGSNDGMVVFQTPTFRSSSAEVEHVLVHETCHHYDFQGVYSNGIMRSENIDFGFLKLSGWKNIVAGGVYDWYSKEGAKFVSDYAQTQPIEDFAETCASYVNNPNFLKNKAPEKYAFMKEKVFGGKEFFKTPHVWKELEDAFNDPQTCSTLFKKCLNKFFVKDTCSIYSKSSSGDFEYKNFEQILYDSCFKEGEQERINETTLKLLIMDRKRFCQERGVETIQKNENSKRCIKAFQEGVGVCVGVKQYLETKASDDCFKKGDFSFDCQKEKISLKTSILSPESLSSFYDFSSPALTSAFTLKIFNQISPAKMLLACFTSDTKIVFPEYSGQTSFILKSKNATLRTLSNGVVILDGNPCQNGMKELIKNKGLVLDSHAADFQMKFLLESQNFKDVLKDYTNLVVSKKADIDEKCRFKIFQKRKCIKEIIEPAIDTWWNKYSSTPMNADEKDQVIDFLF